MSTAVLTINLGAIAQNWRDLNTLTGVETAAVVKANAYGLGIERVATALAEAGARQFFVAVAEEGVALRGVLGADVAISVFSGHMEGDTGLIRDANLVPMINSIDQMVRHVEALPAHPFGLQLDTGMNRLGMEDPEWRALRDIALGQNPTLIMSHLACADTPDHPMNEQQLARFEAMTNGVACARSLSATGGVLLGPRYHFELTRPGIGIYGGLPYVDAIPVATLDVPVIQVRDVAEGETVGYGNMWNARKPARIATVSAGYADGLIRAMGPRARMHSGDTQVPVVGRVSMDLIGVDVSALEQDPVSLQLLGQHQSVDTVAGFADTIGYEILTSLGARYKRMYRT
ncbi:MAG: alanine racemase [Pseudomonadota bacterium]